jgi:8-oxo-dGTP pyrophosphatase MutT (NUDIX family)
MIKHLTASVFILGGRRDCRIVLLHHRRFDKWMIPGGHVENWENPFEAAQREVREETGLVPQFVTFAAGRNLGSCSLGAVANSVPHPEIIVEEVIPAAGAHPEHIHIDCLYVALAGVLRLRPGPQETSRLGLFGADELAGLDMFEQTRALARAIMGDLEGGREMCSVVDGSKLL